MQIQLLILKLMNKLKGWFEQFEIFLSKGTHYVCSILFGYQQDALSDIKLDRVMMTTKCSEKS